MKVPTTAPKSAPGQPAKIQPEPAATIGTTQPGARQELTPIRAA